MKYFAKVGESSYFAIEDYDNLDPSILPEGDNISDYLEMPSLNLDSNSNINLVAIPTEEYGKGIWGLPEISLEDLKEEISLKLAKIRQEYEYMGPLVPIGDEVVRFSTTTKDETRLLSVIDKMEKYPEQIPYIDNWKVGPHHFIKLDLTTAKMAQIMGFIHISNTFTIEQQKLTEIDNCTTVEELKEWADTKLHDGWDIPQHRYDKLLIDFNKNK
jgi:ribosome-associated toxin RatA of RatAB toxin-antitoxin module